MTTFDDRARKAAAAVREQLTEHAADDRYAPQRARRPVRRWVVPSAAAVALAVAAVTVPGIVGGGDPTQTGGAAFAAPALKPFGDCTDVRAYFVEHAADYLIGGAQRGGAAAGGGTQESRPTAADSRSAAAPQHSTTNTQEAGVDEPDLVKTDGRRIAAVAQGRVHLIAAENGRMTRRATLPTTDVSNVFLAGNRLLVFSRSSGPVGADRGWAGDRSVLTTYDITRLDAPKVVATLTVEGEVIDARLVGSQVRVATSSVPDLDIPSPVYTDDGQVSDKSKEELRAAVARTTVDDWVPSYTLKDAAGKITTGRLVQCPDLARPDAFSGLDTVAVSAFTITAGFGDRLAAGVVAGGEQLYASDTATYVTSTAWDRDEPAVTTEVHKFVTAASGATAYRGSGAVRGTLLNQYAMSEYQGVLRVASTLSERRGWANPQQVNEGAVTTLGEQDGQLRQLGQVDGLGRADNESIQAVRFIGDRAYIVTYRQTDPLYVVDLRNPATPAVVGELKIPGYSGYLHPVGRDLVLGVGQSGESSGTKDGASGVQFSLFDVRDPAAPRRVDTQTYGSGNAMAEWDPKAFLFWQPRKLVVAPVMLNGDQRGRGAFAGVMLLRSDPTGLKDVGRIAVRPSEAVAQRSFVIGDYLYVLSDQGLQSQGLDDPRRVDRLEL